MLYLPYNMTCVAWVVKKTKVPCAPKTKKILQQLKLNVEQGEYPSALTQLCRAKQVDIPPMIQHNKQLSSTACVAITYIVIRRTKIHNILIN